MSHTVVDVGSHRRHNDRIAFATSAWFKSRNWAERVKGARPGRARILIDAVWSWPVKKIAGCYAPPIRLHYRRGGWRWLRRRRRRNWRRWSAVKKQANRVVLASSAHPRINCSQFVTRYFAVSPTNDKCEPPYPSAPLAIYCPLRPFPSQRRWNLRPSGARRRY